MSKGAIEIGDLIDNRYRILEVLGRGGMGTVYRAEHVGIRREVAIKIMHGELRGDALINERLTREAFATARMDHPNCVSVTDSGTMPEGEPFLVMELLVGQSLGDELEKRTTVPIGEALHIAKEILKGLQHAHSLGIVHRDLKPDNIFLVPQENAFPIVKILDFGIVKLQGDAVSDIGGEDLTMAGMAIGSPVYMSPEQATGAEIDERTDLYSLSLVLYEMLNGEPPYYERSDKLQSLKRRLFEPPPALLDNEGQAISARLESILHHGLGLRPQDRIPTAIAYLDLLRAMDEEIQTMSEAVKSTGIVESLGATELGRNALPLATMNPVANRVQSGVTPKMKRMVAYAGIGGVVVLGIGIASFSGGTKSTDEPELLMDVEDMRTQSKNDPKAFAEGFSAELTALTSRVEAGDGEKVVPRLKKLQSVRPEDALANRLLGLAYMEKRYWKDGFKHLRLAISRNEMYRTDEYIIKAALRSLTSKRRPLLGVRFLVDEIGEDSIPYLRETAKKGGDRQREYALVALQELSSR